MVQALQIITNEPLAPWVYVLGCGLICRKWESPINKKAGPRFFGPYSSAHLSYSGLVGFMELAQKNELNKLIFNEEDT